MRSASILVSVMRIKQFLPQSTVFRRFLAHSPLSQSGLFRLPAQSVRDFVGTKGSPERSAALLHLNTALNALFGMIYLGVVARLYDKEIIGRDMALVSAMMMLAALAEMNLGNVLIRFLPQLGRRSQKAVVKTYSVTTIAAVVLSIGFVAFAPLVNDHFAFVHDGGLVLGAGFVLAVVAWNIFAINDSALTAIRHTSWVPLENGVFGALKVVTVALFGLFGAVYGVFLSWTVPLVMVVIPVTYLLFRRALPRHVATDRDGDATGLPSTTEDAGDVSDAGDVGDANDAGDTQHKLASQVLGDRRNFGKYVAMDYLASIFSQAGTTVLPLVVVALLGTEANGTFALAFSIIIAIEQLSLNAATVVTVEGAFDERRLGTLVRHTLTKYGAFLLLVVVGGILGAPIVAWIFGAEYTSDLPQVLQLLLIGLVPQAIQFLFEAIARVQGRAERVLYTSVAQMTITLTLAFILAGRFGLPGIGLAWIVGHTVVALAVLPSVLRTR